MRTLKVKKTDELDLSFIPLAQKKSLFPFLVKAVGVIIALKILFRERKEKELANQVELSRKIREHDYPNGRYQSKNQREKANRH